MSPFQRVVAWLKPVKSTDSGAVRRRSVGHSMDPTDGYKPLSRSASCAALTTFSILAAVSALATLGGCTILAMQRDESADEARIHDKEAALQAEQARADQLNQQKTQLEADLAQRQLSLIELNQRVEELRESNARESNEDDIQRIERRQLLGQLQRTNAEFAALHKNADTSTQKQERIEFLKRQLATQLDLLLH